MNNEVKQQWLAALRGPDYQQGHKFLRTGLGFCCLGVLCDLFIKATGKGRWDKVESVNNGVEGDAYYNFVTPDSSLKQNKILPDVVIEWAGLKDNESP